MKKTEVQICRCGNGDGLHLTKPILDKLGVRTGDRFILDIDDGKIVLTLQKRATKPTLRELFKDYNGPSREELFGKEMTDWENMKSVGKETL